MQPEAGESGARMGRTGLVTAAHRLAKHKVAGSTPVTRSQSFRGLSARTGAVETLSFDHQSNKFDATPY